MHHDGKPVPSEPHIAMTVETLRDAGAIVDDGEPEHVARRALARSTPLDVLGRAGPVQRRTVPRRRAGHRRHGCACPAGRSTRPRPATRCATSSTRWAPTSALDRDRPHRRPAAGELVGIDVDLHDASELTPVVAALAALADSPSWIRGVAHIRGHETDRLAALATELGALGGAVTETEDGLRITPAPVARRAVPHLPRPPDGDRRRDPRPARAGRRRRGHRHDGQDPARLRRPVAPPCSRAAPPPERADPPMSWQRPRRGRHPGPPEPQGVAAAHQGPPGPRGRRRRGFVIGVDRGRYTVPRRRGCGWQEGARAGRHRDEGP